MAPGSVSMSTRGYRTWWAERNFFTRLQCGHHGAEYTVMIGSSAALIARPPPLSRRDLRRHHNGFALAIYARLSRLFHPGAMAGRAQARQRARELPQRPLRHRRAEPTPQLIVEGQPGLGEHSGAFLGELQQRRP